MAEELPVEVPEDVPIAVPGDNPMSARDAARALASVRWSKPKEEAPEPMAAEPAVTESGEEPVAAPETEPGEQPQAVEPAEVPPIEPPRSWTKAEKEEFQSYPREAQEKIARREQERETALRRGQNEAAEQRKALEAQIAQAEQTRRQYEEALPQLLATLQQQQMGEFSDIRTMADVEKLAREDWPRFAAFQAQQMKVQAVQQQMRESQERQSKEYQAQWDKFSKDEDAKFIEAAPEMANPDRATKVRDASIKLLNSVGFSEEDLGKLWNGQASLSLRDHRTQLMLLKAALYDEAKAGVPKAAAKPVPKVQRPGSPAQRAPDADAQERALYNKLDETRGLNALRLGAQLLANRRAARQ